MDTLERTGESTRAPPGRDPDRIDEQWSSDGFAVLKNMHADLRAMSVELETAIKTGDGQHALELHGQIDVLGREIHELLDAWGRFLPSNLAIGSAD